MGRRPARVGEAYPTTNVLEIPRTNRLHYDVIGKH